MTEKPAPTMKDVKDFLSAGVSKPVTTAEFTEFWKSCSDELKTELKNNLAEA